MASIYSRVLREQVAKGYSDNVLRKTAEDQIKARLDDAVIGMQREFEEHPVTMEISAGISSDNISQTLGGGPAPRNLFSFIGFYSEKGDPTDNIRKQLTPEADGGPNFSYLGKDSSKPLTYKFEVNAPDLKKIYEKTPMPWGSGLSWAQKIESSIPGLAKFFSAFLLTKESHSGGGLQHKNDLHPGDNYTPPANKYLSTIFKNFLARVKLPTKSARQGR